VSAGLGRADAGKGLTLDERTPRTEERDEEEHEVGGKDGGEDGGHGKGKGGDEGKDDGTDGDYNADGRIPAKGQGTAEHRKSERRPGGT